MDIDFLFIIITTMSAILLTHLFFKYSKRVRFSLNKFDGNLILAKNRQRSRSCSDSSQEKNKIRIYTRTGDSGSSGLFTGERRPKDDHVFEALGTTDELSSSIGLAREFLSNKHGQSGQIINSELEKIQCVLQDLQSAIATPKSSARESHIEKTKWDINHLVDLEEWIDIHSDSLPPLKNFILPSGGKASSSLHLARAICRRAERRLVPLLDDGLELPVLQYLNRLSSYLFIIARLCALKDGHQEMIYRRIKRED